MVYPDGSYGGPAQPSPTIGQRLSGGYGWLQVKCHRCGTETSLPLDAIRRPRDTPIWKLEAALKCRSCWTPRYSPRVHMVKLTMQREIAPYAWVRPDDDDRR
jgi:predicted CxxxxCH...CXXCH cytochrome family protein